VNGQRTDQSQTMHVLKGTVAPCHRLAVYLGLSNDHPWDYYRQYVCVRFGLHRQAMHTRDVRSCTISFDLRATRYRKVNDIAISRNRYELVLLRISKSCKRTDSGRFF